MQFEGWEPDEFEQIFCPKCLERGYKIQLSGKILETNEPRPEDYDQWLQCGACYWLCPIHEAYKEELIKNSIVTIESPFDNNSIIESLPNRTTHTLGKKPTKSKRRNRNKLKLDPDPEIADLLRIYGDRVNVLK